MKNRTHEHGCTCLPYETAPRCSARPERFPKIARMENFADICAHAFEHAFFDTLGLIPFLFVTYLAMEALEHYASSKSIEAVQRAGAAGPVIGAVLGVVPQCGFSAAASTLYSARVVTLGTLFAVLLSTSDEMLPVMIAAQAPIEFMVEVLVIKAICGMAVGLAVDAVLRMRHHATEVLRIHDLCAQDHCGCEDDEEDTDETLACTSDASESQVASDNRAHEHVHEHGHAHDHGHATFASIAKSACKHTLQVTLFIFLVSLALELVIDSIGEEALGTIIASNEALSVVASAIVGLIPNCAASVAITELYLDGALSFGAMMSGLLVSAGVGLLVLFRANRPMSRNVLIVCVLVATSVIIGGAFTLFGVTL